jgi:hypothetical protein
MEVADEPAETASEDDPGKNEEPIPVVMEVHYSIPSSARKALAHAIGKNIGAYPSYQAAASFYLLLYLNTPVYQFSKFSLCFFLVQVYGIAHANPPLRSGFSCNYSLPYLGFPFQLCEKYYTLSNELVHIITSMA